MSHPVVLFALGREASPFLRGLPLRTRIKSAPCRAQHCGPSSVLVLETGVGRERMTRALDWLLGQPAIGAESYVPPLVISAGFSGALREELRVGDLILATEVVGTDGVCHPVRWAGSSHDGWYTPLQRGRIVTVDRTIALPEEKLALARQHDALAVDMETATIAGRCNQLGIPFACLRVISDDAHAVLSPELDYVIVNGRLSFRRLGASLLRRPGLARELWRLAKNTRLAADRLAEALGKLLTLNIQ